MRNVLIALLAGALFGAGLAISGMLDPARIRGFLDVFGHWDPTLAFVMAGAVGVMAAAWMLTARMQKPIYVEALSLPPTGRIDARLIIGSAIFGVGWGLSGLCPGPAIANLALNPRSALIFIGPMLLGMAIQRIAFQPGQISTFIGKLSAQTGKQ
ncbi:DUF6691 family protein [Sphingomonas sp. TREG-RG-20F-R18-01]|uniref:DUF6691 family protein n=1 Tax=Sphingomonas sp. TREG-RG-20F-R18-01 TaxID=2914982 RepID=UPI001F5AC3A9